MNITETAKRIVSEMTVQEKIDMLSGGSLFAMNGNERFGLPSYGTSDGPHGIKVVRSRKEEQKAPGSVTCFPTAAALANSWNRDLLREMGALLADEAQKEGTGVCLAPAVNIKRHPLCGRNFEYYSEDPCLAGELGTAAVLGIQSQGVPACVKHFAVNNQEYRRKTIDAVVEERALREIYLAVFEKIVKQAKPETMMCSYNKVNGSYMAENRRLLTDILRKEWGFEGMVMSDWGAVHDRVEGIRAGLDLEMPGGFGFFDQAVRAALEQGTLSMGDLDDCVLRVVKCILFIKENKKDSGEIDAKGHHKKAEEMAKECMVLLKNDGILPLEKGQEIAVIGGLAEDVMYQGGGSSKVMNKNTDQPLAFLQKYGPVRYFRGYDPLSETQDEKRMEEALAGIAVDQPVLFFLGQIYGYESEEYDRIDMKLPENQTALLNRVLEKTHNVVAVLLGGSPVEMDWEEKCRAVLYASLAGEGVGAAVAESVFGDHNPCGKLAETFPLKLAHTPAYLSYPGTGDTAVYGEGIYVGYRYYDKKELPVRYPFGYGLSYTEFAYDGIAVDKNELTDRDTLKVICRITNRGKRAGAEIVQLYIRDVHSTVDKPVRELKNFEKIRLEPGETGTVSFELSGRDFSYYETRISDWHVESGEYVIELASSSRDIRQTCSVYVKSTTKIEKKYTEHTLICELKEDAFAFDYVARMTEQMPAALLPGYDHPIGPMGMDKKKQRHSMELQMLASGTGANKAFLSEEELGHLLDVLNKNQ